MEVTLYSFLLLERCKIRTCVTTEIIPLPNLFLFWLYNIPVIFPGLYENVIATSSIHQMLDQINVTVCRSQNHISEPNNAATDIIACQQEAAIQILTVFWKIPFIGLENCSVVHNNETSRKSSSLSMATYYAT